VTSTTTDISGLLREDLLKGVSVLIAGTPSAGPLPGPAAELEKTSPGVFAARLGEVCADLGARVSTCEPDPVEEATLDAEVLAVGDVDLLAVDGAGLFAGALDGGGHKALRSCMDCAWNATRAVVNHAFLAANAQAANAQAELSSAAAPSAGRIVYLAPAPTAGAHAAGAIAGLENLARTLSIEWARHGITTVTIAPGARTAADEVAMLVAYLASPAGAYFSGCLLDLRGS
jgi:NAD(P)-dependent dehydrogenase (short-subunit alcohol dehydrogenase family)